MRLFRGLWQKVFAYSLVLVIVVGAMGVFLVHANLTDRAASVVLAFTSEVRNALAGQTPEEAGAFLARFNTQEARFWLEDGQGSLLAGQRFAGRAGKDWSAHLGGLRQSGEVALWRTNLKTPMFLATAPCALRGKPATLYAAYMAFPVPPLDTLLSPGIITLALITGLLALWMALTVGRPLRRLRREVSAISGSPPQLRSVTVSGSDEIADVGLAINRLVASLRSHIDGMNQLVLNISHELRSPIARMSLSVEMIGRGLALRGREKEGGNDEENAVLDLAQGNFTALCQELEHMNKLIGDTLFTSKLEMKDPAELTETVSLSAICASAGERHESLFRQAEVRFIRSIEDGIAVLGDETLLTQALSNLLDNAVKYAAGVEPLVRLRLFREGERAVVSVESSFEAPLPSEVLERLFDPYFRYNQQVSTGVGLGLAIVHKTVRLHRGEAEVLNTAAGVLFRLSFPLEAPSPLPSPQGNPPRFGRPR